METSRSRRKKVANGTAAAKRPVYDEQTTATRPVCSNSPLFQVDLQLDMLSLCLFLAALCTRVYKIGEPRNVVFDELHYGKYVAMYMKNTFFFDTHPPLGKQLIAAVAYLTNFDGQFKFEKIGTPYPDTVPVTAMRMVPAFFGSLLIPAAYHLMLALQFRQWTAAIGAVLLLFDNAICTQSRFMLMEPMLLTFTVFGIYCAVKCTCKNTTTWSMAWFIWHILCATSLTCAVCIKYVGIYSYFVGVWILAIHFWRLLAEPKLSDRFLTAQAAIQVILFALSSILLYLTVFYIHLVVLYKAGPHDSIMTSAFQASLEGGLASITKGQPLYVAHGSQITLRHTHGRTCWLHSHNVLYPIRYADQRGSSHQQQVTCYSFKDVNNWWIVKRPDKTDLVVEQPADVIRHGDVVQLVHGITSRALNSHDVAAPMSPQCQEVSCYIDYGINMTASNLWRVDILNQLPSLDDTDSRSTSNKDVWHTIKSQVRLIHVETKAALKFSGRQLPDWGFHQHEVVADRIIQQDDTVWNVEEHRYTKSEDQKERERELITAEMIPVARTQMSFWSKLFELHYKMLMHGVGSDGVQNHLYSSGPLEWPLMSRGIAYWVSLQSNAQIHLLGNLCIWISATVALVLYASIWVVYVLRRRRAIYDLTHEQWEQFNSAGQILFFCYLIHYVPFFFVEHTLFLHHYLAAFVFKALLCAALLEHFYIIIWNRYHESGAHILQAAIIVWLAIIVYVFTQFMVLCYGNADLTAADITNLKWRDSWDFIMHKVENVADK